jgi:hypothetical protein
MPTGHADRVAARRSPEERAVAAVSFEVSGAAAEAGPGTAPCGDRYDEHAYGS